MIQRRKAADAARPTTPTIEDEIVDTFPYQKRNVEIVEAADKAIADIDQVLRELAEEVKEDNAGEQ